MGNATSIWWVFGLGTVGALAPEVVRLYGLRSNPEKFQWSGFYVVVSVFFALLGGLIAVVLPAGNLQSAFYTGISTPTLINAILKKTPVGAKPAVPKVKKTTTKGLMAPFEAAEPPASATFTTFVQGL